MLCHRKQFHQWPPHQQLQLLGLVRVLGQASDVRPPGRTEAAEGTAAGAVADSAKGLSASEVLTRQPAACARKCYEAEQSLLRAQQPGCATYVVCPGVLYGEHFGSVALRYLRH